ncbi:adhesion protein FadA, partial [Fusobacterium animalis]
MKAKILLCSMLVLGSLSYAAETTPTDSVAQ